MALVGLAAVYGSALLVRYQISTGVDWVTEMERLHPIALAGVVALGVDLVVDTVWRRDGRRSTSRIDPTGPGHTA